jgi:hypothetical protein
MRPVIFFTLLLDFVITKAATADTVPPSGPNTPHTSAAQGKTVPAHPTAIARPAAAVAGKPRFVPPAGVRQNQPTGLQSLQRGPLVANPSRYARNFQPRQVSELPVTGQQLSGAMAKPAKPVNNVPNNRPRANNNNRNSYADAVRRCPHERHDGNWWRRHCRTIVFVNTGYYYLDAGYWYPAYGYDQSYSYYDTDGPIYTYGNLLPDQVIANVQSALREIGYYVGPITGALGPATRAALANFQRDYGLVITGAVDEPTVQSLGLM